MFSSPCESKDCGGPAGLTAPAALTVFWPGQTLNMCRPCAARAIAVAAAMGFTVEVRTLDDQGVR